MDISQVLRIVSMWPWASAEEIAGFLRCSVSAVNRELNRQQERGLIVHVKAGRKKRPARRWILSSLGVAEAFPFPGDVPWWVTEQGVKTLFQRLEQLEHYYSLAPSIFSLEPEWWAGPGAPALLNWGFFQRGQVIEAWGRYEEDLLIFFCWAGRELKESTLRSKWGRRFSRLETHAPYPDPLNEAPPDTYDWDGLPHPSGYVVVCNDPLSLIQARRVIPRQWDSFLFVAGVDAKVHVRLGGVTPTRDAAYDHDSDTLPAVGYPERAIDAAEGMQVLSGTVRTEILELVEEWQALRASDVARLCGDSRSRVRRILNELEAAELMARVEQCYYLGPAGFRYAGRRDRVSPSVARARLASYLAPTQARHRHQLRHNRMVNAAMEAMRRGGWVLFGGWRMVVDVDGRAQIAPDALGLFGGRLFFIEVERTATTPAQVLRKLAPYRAAADAKLGITVAFIVETQRAKQLFLELGRGMALFVSTLEDVLEGPVPGKDAVFRQAEK